jgi:hypothetical protein
VGHPQLRPGTPAALLPPQPLAVEQVSAGELRAHPGPAQPVDRLAEPGVGLIAFAQQGAASGFYPERPVGAANLCLDGQPRQGIFRQIGSSGPDGRFDQLRQDPVLADCACSKSWPNFLRVSCQKGEHLE